MTSEHLLNLQRIGQLDAVPFSADLLDKMLAVAESRLQDARRVENSMETRFDCAYTAIRAVADAALLKQGFRTSTSKPGHHQTTLQCLVHTLGLEPSTVRVLERAATLICCLRQGDVVVRVDPRYFRPADVEILLGGPPKAKDKLGWVSEITVQEMCAEMVAEDLKAA